MAGWIGYEAGYALEPRLHARLQPGGTPGALLRLFAFDDRTSHPSEEVDDWLAGRAPGNAYLDRLEPAISFAQYVAALHQLGIELYREECASPCTFRRAPSI